MKPDALQTTVIQPIELRRSHHSPATDNAIRPNHPGNPLASLNNWGKLLRGRLPGQVVLQFTDQCNASCAQCGMRRENEYDRSTLNVDDIRRMLDAMAAQGVEAVSFTGGEPLLYLKPIVECIRYARSVGIKYVRTGTNGFMFKGSEKPQFESKMHALAETLATSGLYTFWISIDSASVEVHEKNRGLPGMIAGVEKALPIFHEYGLHPSANLGINRYMSSADKPPAVDSAESEAMFYEFYHKGFRHFYTHVENMGFTIVNACYPMNFEEDAGNAVYTATSMGDFVNFTNEEKKPLFQAMYDVIPEFRHRLRIFTPRSSLRSLIRHYGGEQDDSYACRGGVDFFFVDARDMNTYPCGFRGEENMGRFQDLDLRSLDSKAWCKQCDWECFRDPSELTGPLLDLMHNPWSLGKRFMKDRTYASLWYEDMRYYRACNYFNAMMPPDHRRLQRFAPKQ